MNDILGADGRANVAVLGDFNDYPYSAALQTLAGPPGATVLSNLMSGLPAAERYTYDYRGNSEALSSIFASSALADVAVGYDSVHVNAEFADQESDHDPQVAVFAIPPASPELTITKTVAPTTVTHVGDEVTFSYTVVNSGNVVLSDVAVAEGTFTGSGVVPVPDCGSAAGTLAPAESFTCTASYRVTQPDLDAGEVANTATATGRSLTDAAVVSASSTARVQVDQAAALSLSADVVPTVVAAVGDVVSYRYVVTNDGNVTVSGIAVDATSFTGTGSVPAADCPLSRLAPNRSMVCTATYRVTQADLDAGQVIDTRKAAGQAPNDSAVESEGASTTVAVDQVPALSLVLTVDPGRVAAFDDVVTYTYLVANTGNVGLVDVGVSAIAFTGSGDVPAPDCADTALAPATTTTCTATYRITRDDLDAGQVVNTAVAEAVSGSPAPGRRVALVAAAIPTMSEPQTVVVTVDQAPQLAVFLTADPTGVDLVGEPISYSYLVTNIGNVTLTDVAVAAVGFSGSESPPDVTCPRASLGLADSTTCTATYAVTQADLDAGQIVNTATAIGRTVAQPEVVSAASSVTVEAEQTRSLRLTVTADPVPVTRVGEVVGYAYEVTNSGNVTVRDVSVVPVAFSGTGAAPLPGCPPGPVAPGRA